MKRVALPHSGRGRHGHRRSRWSLAALGAGLAVVSATGIFVVTGGWGPGSAATVGDKRLDLRPYKVRWIDR